VAAAGQAVLSSVGIGGAARWRAEAAEQQPRSRQQPTDAGQLSVRQQELLLQLVDDEDGCPSLLELLELKGAADTLRKGDGTAAAAAAHGTRAAGATAAAAAVATGAGAPAGAVSEGLPLPGVFAGAATPLLLDCCARGIGCMPRRLSHSRHFRLHPRPVAEASVLLPACSPQEALALLTLLQPHAWLVQPEPGPEHLRGALPTAAGADAAMR